MMKLKTTVLATACAFGLAAYASERAWFSADISSYTTWPATETSGTWSGTDGATLNNNKLNVDADEELAFTAISPKTLGVATTAAADSTSATVTSKVKFTPFAETPSADADAKAGVIVVGTTYYGISNSGSGNAWVALVGATYTADSEVVVTITVKNDGKANYKVGDTTLTYADSADIPVVIDSAVSKLTYTGSGTVATLDAVENAVEYQFSVEAPANAKVASVTCGDTTLSEPYTVNKGANVVVTYTANEGYLFANGTTTYTSTATAVTGNGITLPKPADSDAEKGKAKIGTKLYLTLNAAIEAAETDDTVTLLANASTTDVTELNTAIKLDLNGFSFTVADSAAFTVNKDLEVVNGVADQGGLVMQGNIIANAEVDISALSVAAGGLVPKQGGSLTIKADGVVKFPTAWSAKTANMLDANTPGFLSNTEDGATIITGKEYVYDSDIGCWTFDGAVAKATITNAKTKNPMLETYDSLSAALAAANADTTVTLTADMTAEEAITVPAGITLDLNNKALMYSSVVNNGAIKIYALAGTQLTLVQNVAGKYIAGKKFEVAETQFCQLQEGTELTVTADPTTIKIYDDYVFDWEEKDPAKIQSDMILWGADLEAKQYIVDATLGYEGTIKEGASLTIAGAEKLAWLILRNTTLSGSLTIADKNANFSFLQDPDKAAGVGCNMYLTPTGKFYFSADWETFRTEMMPQWGLSSGCEILPAKGYENYKVVKVDGAYQLAAQSNPVIPGNDGTEIEDNGDGSVTVKEGKTEGEATINVSDTTKVIKLDGKINKVNVSGTYDAKQFVVLSTNGTDITAACYMTVDGGVLNAALNPDAVVGGVSVTPTVTESTDAKIADGSVATKTIAGLTYTLVRDENVGGEFGTSAAVAIGTGASVTLTDSEKPAGKAFYKIVVTK